MVSVSIDLYWVANVCGQLIAKDQIHQHKILDPVI